MNLPKWPKLAGLFAIVGGTLALLLTLPFAAAYFIAYPGFEATPFWFEPMLPTLQPMLGFGTAVDVYNTYGRIYNAVYLFLLPAALAVHAVHRAASSRWETWGFVLTVTGLVASLIGVAGDYWANGVGFLLEFPALLVLSVGCGLTGIAARRSRIIPAWCAWLLILCMPAYVLALILIVHIPTGPTFAVAVAYLGVGYLLLTGRVGQRVA